MSEIDWKAVASWCDKEASEHARIEHHENMVDLFSGLARAIRYGIESAELAASKNWIAK